MLKNQGESFWFLLDFIYLFLYLVNLNIFYNLILCLEAVVWDYSFVCKYTVSRILI
jgi:hypothetical protein